MRCATARKYLYGLKVSAGAEPIRQLVQAELIEAEAHLAGCLACQGFFAAELRWKRLLKAKLPPEKAPASLREKVLFLIAQERGQSTRGEYWIRAIKRRRLGPGLIGLLLAAMLVGGLWLNGRRARVASRQFAPILIDDHAHSLPGATEIASSDPRVVQSWFQGRVDFAFMLPPTRQASLLGGRLCNLQGRRAALIFYQHPQSRLSLFIFDGSDIELPEKQLVPLDGKRCLIESQKGYNVVQWKERGLLYGLVSDLGGPEMLQLARQF